jgi:hypothetical protein
MKIITKVYTDSSGRNEYRIEMVSDLEEIIKALIENHPDDSDHRPDCPCIDKHVRRLRNYINEFDNENLRRRMYWILNMTAQGIDYSNMGRVNHQVVDVND